MDHIIVMKRDPGNHAVFFRMNGDFYTRKGGKNMAKRNTSSVELSGQLRIGNDAGDGESGREANAARHCFCTAAAVPAVRR